MVEKRQQVLDMIDEHAKEITDIVDSIILPYTRDLDRYVTYIRDKLKDGVRPPTTDELDNFCMNLSTYIYFASSMAEQIGIRDDISKAVYKDKYNKSRNSIVDGTVADKNTFAELQSQEEQLINVCYSRAYKIVKSKVDNAQELLSSCKKVLSHRISEIDLTRISRNGG